MTGNRHHQLHRARTGCIKDPPFNILDIDTRIRPRWHRPAAMSTNLHIPITGGGRGLHQIVAANLDNVVGVLLGHLGGAGIW
ncbi:hypothetical protein [Mycobacterium sp. 1245801.1]|uniref:hypothetical protein n=1 Tax=Mycobacterium sp. 1245801.1 TaxID=1834075 RepID=UPI0008008E8A|nr:hypothetical protein [Mycobacterium sp. 1245801.1]OBJ19797.1 hypothetical protein A5622_20290 [Mycobacterium sp. 1245801.1]